MQSVPILRGELRYGSYKSGEGRG